MMYCTLWHWLCRKVSRENERPPLGLLTEGIMEGKFTLYTEGAQCGDRIGGWMSATDVSSKERTLALHETTAAARRNLGRHYWIERKKATL